MADHPDAEATLAAMRQELLDIPCLPILLVTMRLSASTAELDAERRRREAL